MTVESYRVANVFFLYIIVIILIGFNIPNSFSFLNLLNLVVHLMPNLA